MKDKVQIIREEVARIQLYTQSEILKQVLDYIDEVQEEPVKIKKGCKYRCLSDMVNKDTGNIAFIGDKIYLAPKDNALVSEENGWLCDTSENASNFELVEEYTSKIILEGTNFNKSWYAHPELAFKAGAKWQKEQFEKDCTDLCNGIATAKGIAVAMAYDKGMADAREQMMKNIWKPADGDDLPECEREVVVFTQIFPDDTEMMRVAIGHRPNPNGWDGKSLSTGKVEHYTPKTYGEGGWNIPDVKYWLDVKLPKEMKDD